MNELFTLMKSELVLTGIIFLLLFIKIGKGLKNETLLPLMQVLLLANFIFGFVFNKEGRLFGDMYYTTELIAFQKNILNLGVYLITLLCADWLFEVITGRKPGDKFMEYAQTAGMILLLALLVYANVNDIVRLFTGN